MKAFRKGKTIWVYVVYFVLALALLIRAKFGFCWTDESYYVSCVNRFLSGDRIITDDWYISQLFSILLYPVVAGYKFFRSLDGVFLFLRILYVILQTIIAVYFYKVMVKKGIDGVSGFCGSLVIMFYCKAYICTLSYYSVIFIFFVLLLLYLYSYQENQFIKNIALGICTFIIILINPYFMGIYLLALVILLVANFKKSKDIKKINFQFVLSLIGILICVVTSGVIVFRNNPVSDIIECISLVLDDSDYSYSLAWKIVHTFLYVIRQFKYTTIFMCLNFGCSLYLLKKRKLTEKGKNIIFILSFIIFVINCLDSRNWNGGIQTAFAILGLQSFMIDENRNWKLFMYFYLPGIIMAVMMNLSSDTAFNAMTLGFTISASISCIFVYDLIKKYKNKIIYAIGMLSICIVVIVPAFFRFYVVYRDSALINLKAEITEGPAKGLYTTHEHKEQYQEVMEVMKSYCSGKTVFVSSWCPWAYLCTDMKCGAYTTWNLKIEKNEEKLMKYYTMYPERIPDVVIELNDEIGKIDRIDKFPDLEFLYVSPQADSKRKTSFLWKYMEENNYEKIPVKCGMVYIKEGEDR